MRTDVGSGCTAYAGRCDNMDLKLGDVEQTALTLTIHSNGFKDMSETFTVSQGEEIPVTANLAAYGIDMMSSATYSGSVSGDSSSGTIGGGQQISADVKFNADLLINAMIIAEQLGIENDSAQAICDRWNSMTPDSVSAADTTLGGFDWNAYYSAVSLQFRLLKIPTMCM